MKAGDIPSLENRDGTDKDRNKLQETLQKFNFAIISKNNLRSDQVISEIRKGAEQAQEYSAYFVCILSHGIEGSVLKQFTKLVTFYWILKGASMG